MPKFSFKRLVRDICIAYTLISLIAAVIQSVMAHTVTPYHLNQLLMFIWTCIALGSLSLYYCFENWSTLRIVVLQYVVAMGLVCLSLVFIGLLEPLHPDALKDAFISFTVPYVIGALLFNVSIHMEVHQMNQKLSKLSLASKNK